MPSKSLAFVGGGNMARSLIGGLVASGYSPGKITAADPSAAPLDALASDFDIRITADNGAAIDGAQVVIFAVKPQIMHRVAKAAVDAVQRQKPLILSVVAGIREADIQNWLGGGLAIVRTMPNRPALFGHGATGLYANALTEPGHKETAQAIMSAVGETVWVEEEAQMDLVTAVSGSGPAYFFLLMEVMEDLGRELGLSADAAHLLSVQTGYGATLMARDSEESLKTLREQVTSAGGTTAAALAELERGGFDDLMRRAIQAAQVRSQELALEFGKD